ncbi:MAG: C-GCAxxG-C-C family (seleno)protein [Myxococcota bacterium]
MPNRPISSLRTVGAFLNGRACSDTMLYVLNRAFDRGSKPEELAAMPFAGGIMQHGYQCGLIWGAALAAGAQAHRLHGPGPQAETRAILASQQLVDAFRAKNTHINCLEITDLDKSSSKLEMVTYFVIKGGTIGCLRRAARYAHVAYEAITEAIASDTADACCAPVSCASVLARKMGASERHATMAAGLAGGIGLRGGACGALGAAIWLLGLRRIQAGADKADYEDPKAAALIEALTTNSSAAASWDASSRELPTTLPTCGEAAARSSSTCFAPDSRFAPQSSCRSSGHISRRVRPFLRSKVCNARRVRPFLRSTLAAWR